MVKVPVVIPSSGHADFGTAIPPVPQFPHTPDSGTAWRDPVASPARPRCEAAAGAGPGQPRERAARRAAAGVTRGEGFQPKPQTSAGERASELAWADAALRGLGVPSPAGSARRLEGQRCRRAGFCNPSSAQQGESTKRAGRAAWARPARSCSPRRRTEPSLAGPPFPGSGERLVRSQGWGLVREGGEEELKEVENGEFGFLFFTRRSAACQSPRGSPPPRARRWNSRKGAVTVLGAARPS